ncbi:hypothetical protein HW932_02975 [Allochromatium humboldtianum]|uniref:Tetratricopeptide repeat protein n=1 Tax=Allochromatium humboldtianum TaxID=504901 RepID=A0A850RAB7_9GAMM|nr:ATP-binding protein [Allochromatium humboldtianum]NVZ08222.1 hypothetical protein [Allochromatium humboldtianum]
MRFFNRIGSWRCIAEECGETLDAVPPPSTPETAAPVLDLENLPFPVAYPLAHARDPQLSARDRSDNAIFAAYQAMRTTALLLLADYLACDTVCFQLQKPIRGLRQPHWYEWSHLCDRLCQFWSNGLQEHPERETHFPHLVAAWQEVNRSKKLPKDHPWLALLAGLPGIQGPAAHSPNDALWKARNNRAHRNATRTVDDGDELARLPRLLELVETMVHRLFACSEFTLWRRFGDGAGAIRLHGPHADLSFAIEDSPELTALNWGSTGLLVSTPTADLPVYPLFVPSDAETLHESLPGGGLMEPVGLVEGIGEKKVVVLGAQKYWGDFPHLVGPIQRALARKEVQLELERTETTRWTLASWAAVTASDTLDGLCRRKYFPDLYLERAGVETVARAVLDRSGRGLLLLGEAGSGKSSLLARWVDHLLHGDTDHDDDAQRYLAQHGRGDVVLFLSGADAYKGDAAWSGRQTLCEAVLRRAGIRSGEFADLNDLFRHLETTANEDLDSDRRVWLILDALNEADRFTDLIQALDDILPALERHAWLRLAVSLRSGAYHALVQRHHDLLLHGTEVFTNSRYLASFTAPNDKVVPYLDLRPFTETEAAQAYDLRRQRGPELSCIQPYDALAPALRHLLRAPLYLHLLHETFRGRTDLPVNLDQGRLLGAYLDRMQADLPGMATYLERLGRLMFERRIPVLPIEEADAWVTEWRARLGAQSALCVVKLDPVEELVSASLLMRPAEEGRGSERRLMGYGFTYQRLCEQVLLRELQRQIHPRSLPTAAELLAWAHQAERADAVESNDFPELAGALEIVTAELARAGQGQILAALLDLNEESVRTRLLESALKTLGPLGRTDKDTSEAVIAPMINRALTEAQLSEHWAVSTWEVQDWLVNHGYSLVARQVGESRLLVIRALVALQPERSDLKHQLSASLDNLGRLMEAAGNNAAAKVHLEESLEIMRALVTESGRSDFKNGLSASFSNLGRLMEATGEATVARTYFEKSLGIMRHLVIIEPGQPGFQRNLSVSLNNLGRLMEATGDGKMARTYFEESAEIIRHLVTLEPGRTDLKRDLSASLNALGRLAWIMGDGTMARVYFEELLEIGHALIATDPEHLDLKRELAVSLDNLGRLSVTEGDITVARTYFEKSLEIMRDLVVLEPGRSDFYRRLSVSLDNLGRLAMTEGDVVAARTCFEESLMIMRTLIQQEPKRLDLKHDLSIYLSELGSLAEAESDGASALAHFQESLKIRRDLVVHEPARIDFWGDLAKSLGGLWRLSKAAGDEAMARAYYDEALEIWRTLVKQEPGRPDLRVGLAISYWNQYLEADPEDEPEWLRLILDILRPLREAGVLHKQLNQIWGLATQALHELGKDQ